MPSHQEPTIAVGLLDECDSAHIQLSGSYQDASGDIFPPGALILECRNAALVGAGINLTDAEVIDLEPTDSSTSQFQLEATIGINFHWQQRETQSFHGGLRILAKPNNRLTVINRVPLETYLMSVVCSEMKASSPPEFIKAHSIISRSWLLAQLDCRDSNQEIHQRQTQPVNGELIRWTEREAHADFDVCADDHCQRYQGTARINEPGVMAAIRATRGEVLSFNGRACDARFSKSCGGVIEEFPTAWGDQQVPYLVALLDNAGPNRQPPALFDEQSMRAFLQSPPPAYCNCHDAKILGTVLNDYDLATKEFFRWQVRLTASEASDLVTQKLGTNLGRLLKLEPVERGPSGRLIRLRLVGENGTLVIGKELEIRRALSPNHLYSSAFVVDMEGRVDRPDAFILTGAGWGHGVGLCQIGAAVMAHQGIGYREILEHYYPGARIAHFYS